MPGSNHPTEGGCVPWFPLDVLKFCCDMALLAVGTSTLRGSTEHKRYDNYCGVKLLFCAHQLFKSDSGQLSNVWCNWANFQLDLLNGRGLFVRDFKLVHDGYYAVTRCFVSANPIPSKREIGGKHRHALVKHGELRNKLYLFGCNAIESEATVVRSHGNHDQYFVLGNREQWLFNFCETMAALE
eukprot:jgi/Psemu1/42431/gm1.42431_g